MVLSEIESRPEKYNITVMAHISRFYMGGVIVNGTRAEDKIPDSLKARWLRFVVLKISSTNSANDWGGTNSLQFAYGTLLGLFPAIGKFNPPLQPDATILLAALSSKLSPDAVDGLSAEAKSEGRSNQVNERVNEARSKSDQDEKVNLLRTSAELALADGDGQKAYDLLKELKCDEKQKDSTWCDEALESLATKAVWKKESALAEKSVEMLSNPNKRVNVLKKIALHYFNAGDFLKARKRLYDARQAAESIEDDFDKIESILGLIHSYLQIDKMSTSEVILPITKLINNLSFPLDEKSKTKQKADELENLIGLTKAVIPVFKELGKNDDLEAFSFSQEIKQIGIKEAAQLGVCIGVLSMEPEKETKKAKKK